MLLKAIIQLSMNIMIHSHYMVVLLRNHHSWPLNTKESRLIKLSKEYCREELRSKISMLIRKRKKRRKNFLIFGKIEKRTLWLKKCQSLSLRPRCNSQVTGKVITHLKNTCSPRRNSSNGRWANLRIDQPTTSPRNSHICVTLSFMVDSSMRDSTVASIFISVQELRRKNWILIQKFWSPSSPSQRIWDHSQPHWIFNIWDTNQELDPLTFSIMVNSWPPVMREVELLSGTFSQAESSGDANSRAPATTLNSTQMDSLQLPVRLTSLSIILNLLSHRNNTLPMKKPLRKVKQRAKLNTTISTNGISRLKERPTRVDSESLLN